MIDEFDEDIYHCRNLIETMFSVLKGNMGKRFEQGCTEIRLKR
jgi:hypothetical protein